MLHRFGRLNFNNQPEQNRKGKKRRIDRMFTQKQLNRGIQITISIFLCFLFTTLCAFSPAFAAEYYVSPTGDNTNPGIKEKPWQTFSYAREHIQPGDTVYMFPGVYREKSFKFGPAGKDKDHRTVWKPVYKDNEFKGRVMLTGLDDEAAGWSVKGNMHVEGLWLGGYRNQKEKSYGSISGQDSEIIGCTFFNHVGVVLASRCYRLLYKDNT